MIRVGCCGFPIRREKYYQEFPVVEVQQTFYHVPRLSTAQRWRRDAPAEFEFTLKAWQLITHEPSSPTYRRLRMTIPEGKKKNYGFFRDTDEVEMAWRETAAFAEALGATKVVFQCPASFSPTQEHVRSLKQFFRKREPRTFSLIWEPRGSWERTQVERLCEELGIVPCLDPFEGRPIKGNLLYARLHGRTGYHDQYTDKELRMLRDKALGYLEAYLLFNNASMWEDGRRMKALI